MMSKTMSLRKSLFHSSECYTMRPEQGLPPDNDSFSNIFEARQQTLQLCFETLEEFDAWDLEAATYWQNIFQRRGVPTMLGQVSAGASFYDAETACIIVLLRTARLTLLVSILQYYEMIQANGSSEDPTTLGDKRAWEECIVLLRNDVITCIEDILSSVPYAFGDVDLNGQPTSITYDGAAGIIILHSIRWLTFCSYATPEQMQSARKILDRMNASIGIRSAIGVDVSQMHLATLAWDGSPCSV